MRRPALIAAISLSAAIVIGWPGEAARPGQDAAQDRSALEDSDTSIVQIQPSSARDRFPSAEPVDPVRRAIPVDQLATDGQPELPPAQLAPAGRSSSAGIQLNRERATARGSDPLSSSGESRPASIVRLTGPDSCDAGSPDAATERCKRVIEARAAEYQASRPPVLSPEQRLLIDQQARDAADDPATVVRRLGRSGVDADSSDAQSVASLVLPGSGQTGQPEQPADPGDQLDPATLTLIEAIVQNAQGAVPQ